MSTIIRTICLCWTGLLPLYGRPTHCVSMHTHSGWNNERNFREASIAVESAHCNDYTRLCTINVIISSITRIMAQLKVTFWVGIHCRLQANRLRNEWLPHWLVSMKNVWTSASTGRRADRIESCPMERSCTIIRVMFSIIRIIFLGWTAFRAIPATGGRAQAMDARCGSSTHGIGMVPWPVIYLTGLQRANTQGKMFHVNTTHRHVWAMLPPATILIGSLGSASARLTFGQICGSVVSRSCSCGGSKTVLSACTLGPAQALGCQPKGRCTDHLDFAILLLW